MIALAFLALAAQSVDCRAAMTQTEIDACAAQRVRDAEGAMNRAAAQLMEQLKARDRTAGNRTGEERLIAAQRTWLAHRDAQCALQGLQAMDGALEAMLVSACLAEMNARRADELRFMLAGR